MTSREIDIDLFVAKIWNEASELPEYEGRVVDRLKVARVLGKLSVLLDRDVILLLISDDNQYLLKILNLCRDKLKKLAEFCVRSRKHEVHKILVMCERRISLVLEDPKRYLR